MSATPMSSHASSSRSGDARALFEAAVRGAGADALLAGFAWNEAARRRPPGYRRVRLAALGKAALVMAGVATRQLRAAGAQVAEGVAVVPEGYARTFPEHLPAPPRAIDVIKGGHPAPTEASVQAGERALALAERSGEEDLLVVLLSGGGTALVGAPAAGVSLEDARRTFALLLESGADIHAMNTVRKHLLRVGGGQLAQAAAPAETLALAISDVPGDDLSVIASGPTVPDPTTFAEAQGVLQARGLWADAPASVRRRLARGVAGDVPETPKPGAPLFQTVRTRLTGSNADALRAMRAEAESRGYTVAAKDGLEGEAREVGRRLAQEALREAARRSQSAPPMCWLLGGETTVTVQGGGTGGRSQELALAAALALEEGSVEADVEADVALLAAGTDGIDGPTDAAGAVVTPQTAARVRAASLDPAARLADNDAHPVLEAAGALLRPGPTHTNVMDVAAALVGGKAA